MTSAVVISDWHLTYQTDIWMLDRTLRAIACLWENQCSKIKEQMVGNYAHDWAAQWQSLNKQSLAELK